MTKFCPSCGEKLIDSAKFCKNCGKNLDNPTGNTQNNNPRSVVSVEKDYLIFIILGYLGVIVFPLIGIIIMIYLLTRKDSLKAKKHGKYMVILLLIRLVLSFMPIFWY